MPLIDAPGSWLGPGGSAWPSLRNPEGLTTQDDCAVGGLDHHDSWLQIGAFQRVACLVEQVVGLSVRRQLVRSPRNDLSEVVNPDLSDVLDPDFPEVLDPNFSEVLGPALSKVLDPDLSEVLDPDLPESWILMLLRAWSCRKRPTCRPASPQCLVLGC